MLYTSENVHGEINEVGGGCVDGSRPPYNSSDIRLAPSSSKLVTNFEKYGLLVNKIGRSSRATKVDLTVTPARN